MTELGVSLPGKLAPAKSVLAQLDALDRELVRPAELHVTEAAGEARVLGAFQRGAGAPAGPPLVRRVSGGATVLVAPGTLHVTLALAHPRVLYPVDARRLLNRYVRPLLRALTKLGAPASYFGRDWVSVAHRPVASVGFAHDARTGRAALEAFIAVRAPFSEPRASFLGKAPASLDEVAGREIDPESLARAVADAYVEAAGGKGVDISARPPPGDLGGDAALRAEPPWAATAAEAIGEVCAGRDAAGRLRLGGDFLASRDAVARVEERVAGVGDGATAGAIGASGAVGAIGAIEAIGAIVDEAFQPPAALEGIRDLASVRDVLVAALARGG